MQTYSIENQPIKKEPLKKSGFGVIFKTALSLIRPFIGKVLREMEKEGIYVVFTVNKETQTATIYSIKNDNSSKETIETIKY